MVTFGTTDAFCIYIYSLLFTLLMLGSIFLYLSLHANSDIYDSAEPDLYYKAYKSMAERDNGIYYL